MSGMFALNEYLGLFRLTDSGSLLNTFGGIANVAREINIRLASASDVALHLTHGTTMQNLITRFIKDEEGATAIEYGIIAGLISVVLIAAFSSTTGIGGALTTLFGNIATTLGTAGTAASTGSGGG